ncbi:Golgi transport complex subunit 6 [Coemansia biformis]|uniref:Golgi transport complex subunit 6 n=1 Tax=Coemansia biformis TaxID=1286918 RepID=A0A9W8CQ10_9FUNG|nr:Golgi transport complex subunit 6 [Coemansia biformis]
MRRESVARAFVGALVRGGPGGTPRPIEAHAADPQRYVGDMLAWAHQACASERELLDTLFSLAGGGDPPAAGGRGLDGQRSGDAKARLLATVLESIARPLEIRIRQTIDELDEPAAVYRVDGLLEFYCELFAVMCPVDSVFLSTARGLAVSARAKLASCLDALVEAAVNDVDVVGMRSSSSGGGLVSPALEVPASLRVLLTVVVNVLRLHEDSISQPRTGSGGVSAAVAPVGETVARVLERVHREMHAAIGQSDHDKYLRPYEQTMLKLNILNAMQDATMPFTDELCQWHSLGAEEERVLTEQLCAQLVEILKAKSHLPFGPASEQLVEEMGVDRLAVCWDRFNQTLKAATDLDLGRLTARLHSHVAARAVGAQAAQAFVAEYAALQSRVAAVVVAGGSEPGDALLAALHPPETVATLL